jgi:predicted amidohydrolase
MSICYDLRFPELYRELSARGAEIITLPSAFTETTGQAHWEPLIRARAIENQCYVIAANQYGPSEHGFANHGHSMIVDPWGTVLAEAGGQESAVVSAELNSELLAKVRGELPCLRHKRLLS